jgi:hypothetical protein
MNSKIQELKDYKVFTRPNLHVKIDNIIELYKNRTIENIRTAKNLADKLSSRGTGPKKAVDTIDKLMLSLVFADMTIINKTTKRSSEDRRLLYNQKLEMLSVEYDQIYDEPEIMMPDIFMTIDQIETETIDDISYDQIYDEPEIMMTENNMTRNQIDDINYDQIYMEPEIKMEYNSLRRVVVSPYKSIEYDQVYQHIHKIVKFKCYHLKSVDLNSQYITNI